MDTIIDIHAHPVAKSCIKDKRNLRMMAQPGSLLDETPVDTLLRCMDRGGVAKACLMGPGTADGIELTNEMVRDFVRAHPGRLLGFFGVDPETNGREATRLQLETAVKEWGFVGIGEFGGCDYLSPAWEVVFETCIALGIPALVHVGIPLPSMLMKYGHPFMVDELANRYRELNIIAAHVGMPWALETIAIAVRHPNVHLDLAALPAYRNDVIPFLLSYCLERGLENQVLFGSDFPVIDPGTYAHAIKSMNVPAPIRWVTRLPELTPSYKAKVLGANAARLLGLTIT